jgi:hypothetical protein
MLEYNPVMSRRDVAVNTLLGTILLLVLLVYFAAIALIFLFGFLGFDWVVRLAVHGLKVPTVLVAFGVLMLWYCIRDVRKRHWRNAFLFFVSAPLAVFAWFTSIPPSSGGNGYAGLYVLPVLSMFPVFIVMSTAGNANLDRLRFFLAAAVAVASMAVNSGLLGNGALARMIANFLLVAAAAWMIDGVWKGWRTTPPDQPLALPPAGA